jgi:hypothetical protein
VYIYYKIPMETMRGKLMFTNMETSNKVTTFYFTPRLGPLDSFLQLQDIFDFMVYDGWFMYGGRTNYIQGVGTQNDVVIDWTKKD